MVDIMTPPIPKWWVISYAIIKEAAGYTNAIKSLFAESIGLG